MLPVLRVGTAAAAVAVAARSPAAADPTRPISSALAGLQLQRPGSVHLQLSPGRVFSAAAGPGSEAQYAECLQTLLGLCTQLDRCVFEGGGGSSVPSGVGSASMVHAHRCCMRGHAQGACLVFLPPQPRATAQMHVGRHSGTLQATHSWPANPRPTADCSQGVCARACWLLLTHPQLQHGCRASCTVGGVAADTWATAAGSSGWSNSAGPAAAAHIR